MKEISWMMSVFSWDFGSHRCMHLSKLNISISDMYLSLHVNFTKKNEHMLNIS